ncbi:hypothetical protein ANO11243_073220 [Dothideomycetidae sp. 11243]|nr:hypothetical protein ANO11243_073220 [fungal sp. No.11243]
MLSFSSVKLALVALPLGAQLASAAYTLNNTIAGQSFLDHFTFFTATDPTSGFVQYVSQDEAMNSSLIGLRSHAHSNNSLYIGVDANTTLSSSGPGRKSIRLQGKESFTHGLLTLDVYHAPTGCGTWPALWMVHEGGAYPGTTGEIDIFEAVNNATQNSVTLHTDQGCVLSSSPSNRTMSGTVRTPDCWVDAPGQGNSGCSIVAPAGLKYTSKAVRAAGAHPCTANKTFSTAGADFNKQGGGVFALAWTSDVIETYFFPRGLVPPELHLGLRRNATTKSADPDKWRAQGHVPIASFAGCDWDKHVSNLSLVVDTDFCGGWADSTWVSGGCAASTGKQTCQEHVASSPTAFKTAHWLIGGVEVWTGQ